MHYLNIIFGLRAINTPVEREKQITRNLDIYNSTPEATHPMVLHINEQLKEEDGFFTNLNEQETHEVIF